MKEELELKLICHGMMLFWYRPETENGRHDDGYKILIPKEHKEEHKHKHELWLCRGLSENTSRYFLMRMQRKRQYLANLSCGFAKVDKTREPKDSTEHLIFTY
jgi:hypothetical protein